MSKYKVGDKVVFTVTGMFGDVEYQYYALNKDFSVWEKTIDKYSEPLSSYTEPLEAKIRRQAAEITRLLAENKELKEESKRNYTINIEMARAEGYSEAWELARKIAVIPKDGGYGGSKLIEIFNTALINEIFNLTYPEAAEKVAEWEKAKEEIKVGDIVKIREGNNNDLCVLCMSTDKKYYNAVDGYGAVYYMLTKEMITKTGRHIDIDSFLKQIGEE